MIVECMNHEEVNKTNRMDSLVRTTPNHNFPLIAVKNWDNVFDAVIDILGRDIHSITRGDINFIGNVADAVGKIPQQQTFSF